MLKKMRDFFKPNSGVGVGVQNLQLVNASLYSAYLDDRPPFSIANSESVNNSLGLALYLGQVEDNLRGTPEKWRFRLKLVQCRSIRLSQQFSIYTDIPKLPLAGFEKLWQEDLTMMMEREKPVVGSFTLPLDYFSIEMEHLALPFYRKGKIVNIIGAFSSDEMSLRAMRRSKLIKLASIRRSLRNRTLDLPITKRLEGAGAEGRKFWRAILDILDPTIHVGSMPSVGLPTMAKTTQSKAN